MFNTILKNGTPHLIAVAIFLACSAMFFSPQIQGKKLPQGDITSFKGMSHEITQYAKETGKQTLWTNSMFGGMPAYQISMPQKSNAVSYLDKLLKLFIPGPLGMFLGIMLAAYLALIFLKIDFKIAIIAAIAFALSTYNILLVDGGHNTKIITVGYLGLLFAGMHLIFAKNKYLLGGLVFAIGTALSTNANHIQMSYYFILVLAIYFVILLIQNFKSGKWNIFAKSLGTILLAGILGFLTSSQRMIPTYEYQKDTMRGNPILERSNNAGSSSAVDGLAWDYAMRWSHKPIDLLAMFIPGAAGGGNELISSGSKLKTALNQRGYASNRFYLYWGGLESTGGPPYMSILLWFFLLYFFIASKSNIKWWVVGSILLLSLMSLGKYAEFFNKFLFDLLPLLNKFRAPGSISAVIAVPLFIGGAFGLHHLFLNDLLSSAEKYKKLKLAGIIMASFLAIATLGGLLINSFSGLNDANYQQAEILDVVVDARESLFFSSGIRSIILVVLAFGLGWAFLKNKISSMYALIGIGLITIGDLWQMDKKYLPSSKFVQANLVDNAIRPRPVDNLISKDKELYFRVHDLSVDPWNSSIASFFHKTVGGYSPAKMQRYQDMIDRYLGPGNQNVLNMLNTRYIISNQNNTPTANINVAALGNAWFVDEYFLVNTADDEINGVNGIDPAKKAIMHNDFSTYMEGMQMAKNGTIELTNYSPDELIYKSTSNSEQLAIFSDMWYGPNKGWNAYVDGKKVDHARANYILRAMRVPAGEHTIRFKFEPKLAKVGSILSLITSIGLLLAILWLGFQSATKVKEKPIKSKSTAKNKITKRKKKK